MSVGLTQPLGHITPWQSLGPIAPGGSVFGVALSPLAERPRVWAVTGCGVFVSTDECASWRQTLQGLTTILLSAIAVAPDGALFVGALGGELFRSRDGGESWEPGQVVTDSKSTVNAIAVSPDFHRDGTVLAATDGAGVLVSHDSGQHWAASNFGLRDLSVRAVTGAPDRAGRAVAFVATADGVYRSTNGGRAWRPTALRGGVPSLEALVCSPDFGEDRTVLAGSSSGDVYRSQDGGDSWQRLAADLSGEPVNCLWLSPHFAEDGLVLLGAASAIYMSHDRGENWQVLVDGLRPVLSLARHGELMVAGQQGEGIVRSTDAGCSWHAASSGLHARGFLRLAAAGQTLYAFGPEEGLWLSADQGHTWAQASGLAGQMPISMVATRVGAGGGLRLLAGTALGGLLRSGDGGASWQTVDEARDIRSLAFSPGGERAWAGTGDGQILLSDDAGENWEQVETPFAGQEVLAIAASPSYVWDHTLLLGTMGPIPSSVQSQVRLWGSTDGGITWRQLASQAGTGRWLAIAFPIGARGRFRKRAVWATGRWCGVPQEDWANPWKAVAIDPAISSAFSVLALGDLEAGGTLLVGTNLGIYGSADRGRTWQPLSNGLEGGACLSMVTMGSAEGPTTNLYALGLGGLVFAAQLPA